VKCYNCGGRGHIARNCQSHNGGNRGGIRGGSLGGYRGSHRGDYQGGGSHRGNYQDGGAYRGNYSGGGARVNLCQMVGQPKIRETREMGTQVDECGQVDAITANNWEFGDYPTVNTVRTCKSSPAASTCIYPLHYVNVNVSGCDCVALEDSGCQIPVVSKQLFSQCCNDAKSIVGEVMLRGFGKCHTVHAQLVNLSIRMQSTNQGDFVGIPLVCAVADIGVTEYDVILPVEVVRKLQIMAIANTVTGCTVNDVGEAGTQFGDHKRDRNGLEDVDDIPVCSVEAKATAVVPVSDISHVVVTPTPAAVSCDMHSVCAEENKKATHDTSELGDRFNDPPGVCDAVVHQIPTTADFGIHQMRPCQVPDVVQADVDQQTLDLLDIGLSRLSDSPMFSPVMCVAMENNGIHIADNFEELNSYTVDDVCSRSTNVGRDTLNFMSGCRGHSASRTPEPLLLELCDPNLYQIVIVVTLHNYVVMYYCS